MSKDEFEKTEQVRKTLEDCLKYREDLSDLIRQLRDENRPMTLTERKRLPKLMASALLSQGAIECVTLVIEGGWFTFASLQNMILRVSEIGENMVRLTTHKPSHNVQTGSIGELWKFIYDQLLYYYPLASAEAIRLSKESQYRVEQAAYDFDSREGL